MAAKGGESRAGLVVFLVLFILLSIILGVTTYLGYSDLDKARKDAADADKKAKAWENDANWYRFVADTYRMYVGLPAPAGDDVAAMRAQYNDGAGALFSGAQDKGKAEEHRKAIADLDAKKKWDAALKKPAETYRDEVETLTKKLNDAQKAAAKANDDAAKANEQVEATKRELDAAKKDSLEKLAAQRKQDQTETEKLQATITAQQAALDKKGEEALVALKPLVKDNDDLRKQTKKQGEDLKKAIATLNERRDQLAREQSNEAIDVTKIAPENLATVVSVNDRGDMPYISLGSADNLKRQVTFSVYGKGGDGRPLKEPKGKLEVVRVTGEHMAQARITELRDERRDPVLPGDFIYNPAWNPNLKQHVAIIGTIDLTGEGRDNMQEFLRTLKNQNVEVDAYLDMRTLKLKKPDGDAPGEITRQTDLLIVGGAPEYATQVIRSNDAKGEEKDRILKRMQEVTNEAEKLGVRIVRLNNYLETSGFALPKPLGSENKGKIGFQRNLEAAGSPVDRHLPQQPQQPKK